MLFKNNFFVKPKNLTHEKNDLLLNLLLLALGTVLISCSKEQQVKNELSLRSKMIRIENDALTRDYNSSLLSHEIINTAFFSRVLDIKQLENEDARNALIIELSSYQLASNKFSAIKQESMGLTLSEDETIIFQSFIRVIKDSDESTIAIADFFINEIACLSINDVVKMTCIAR